MRASGDNNEDLGVIYYLVSDDLRHARTWSRKEAMADIARLNQGIIDILTPFTLVKRLEHFFKGMKHNKVGSQATLSI